MLTNAISYFFSCLFVLVTHSVMLLNVYFNGNYESINNVLILAAAVLGLDFVYFIIIKLFKSNSYATDFILILILNISVIVQSCFGKVNFSLKHYITCITAVIACKAGFLLCKNDKKLESIKKYYYIAIGIIILVILTLTGSRSMWIDLGIISIQPSEFIKPLFILACATSITEQQKKHKLGRFYCVYENFALFGLIAVICLLQWWCRDLGSLPTFMSIYICGFLMRICYPKAKFSKKTLIFASVILGIIAIIAIKLAPAYVQERLFADIWNDTSGNGYQQSQALIAIANGGWFGKGPGKGFLYNVFAHENDIVFATICEEWGLLFALMIIFAIIMLFLIPLINPPRSYYHATMALGICAAFIVQTALNIWGSCNLIPFTGVTIPFISSGGSSMMTSGFMVGMLSAAQSPDYSALKPKNKKIKHDKRPTIRRVHT